jgi:hypothetical protein
LATHLQRIVVEVRIETLELVDGKLVALRDGIEGVSKTNNATSLKLSRVLKGGCSDWGRGAWSDSGWAIWLDVSQGREEVVGRSGALKVSGNRRGEGQHHRRTE